MGFVVISNLLVLVGLAFGESDVESRIVTTDQGRVRGYMTQGVFAFYGIPYATTPTGQERFKPPYPPPTWTNIFEATNKNIFCPQPPNFVSTWQEDCLIVNVFVPDTNATSLPVIIYIHGGGYIIGSGNNETPSYELVKQGFIFVNFNYRLGVIGFLCLGTEDVSGNAGMKDQVAALRWVKKNIAHFGGNPDDITISGGSAGASSAELLMLSDTTRGLFQKVNCDSGSAFGVWTVQNDPLSIARRFARSLNFTSENVFELEEFYKSVKVDQLISDLFWKQRDSTFMFSPCVERDSGSEKFLREPPVNIVMRGDYPKMPMLFGFTNMEGLFREEFFDAWKDEMNANFAVFLPANLKFESEAQKTAVAGIIKQYYFGDQPVSNDTLQGYVNYFGDIMFAYPVLTSVKLQVAAGNDKVHLYHYSYWDASTETVQFIRRLYPEPIGASHMTQTIATRCHNYSTFSEEFNSLNGIMRELWSNFFLTGKPLPEATALFPHGWPAVSPISSPYMELNLPSELRQGLLSDRARFWDDIYGRYGRKPVPPMWANGAVNFKLCGVFQVLFVFLVVRFVWDGGNLFQ